MFRVYVFVIWCFLTIRIPNLNDIDESLIRLDEGSSDNGNPVLNYSLLQLLITRSKSVFISGKKIDLNEWLGRIKTREDEEDSANSRTMYTFLKCECADHIVTATREISELLKNCPTGGAYRSWPDRKRCKEGTTYLQKLNDQISLALTTLLAISDYYPNLKSYEPYFLKTLLMTYLYVESKLPENEHHEKFRVVPSLGVLKTQRVVLQITNLVQGFTAEHCYSSTDKAIGNPVHFDSAVFIDRESYDFHRFFTEVITSNTARPARRPLIDLDDFMLSDCVAFHAPNGSAGLRKLCRALSQKAIVKITTAAETADKYKTRSIDELHASIRHTYDVKPIYEYMLIVYKVLLKLIYQETQELLSANSSIGFERLTELKTKLQTMKCPIEMIHHFELLLKIQTLGKYETAGSLNKIKLSSIDYVDLRFKLSDLKLNFTEFMDLILGIRFRQFWPVFNLLRRDSETRSSRAYDLSLDLFPADRVIGFSNEDNAIKCDALINVYVNYFKIESANNKSLITVLENLNKPQKAPVTGLEDHFRRMRMRNTVFSNYLLELFEDSTAVEYLNDDEALLNIIINAIIHLNNEFNTSADGTTVSQSEPPAVVARLLIDRHEKVNRTGDVVMNLLDNYQIRNCKDLRDRDFVYRDVYVDNHDRNVERLVAITFQETQNDFGPYLRADLSRIKYDEPDRSKDRKKMSNPFSTKHLYAAKNISRQFYYVRQLTAWDVTEEFKSLGTDIVFDWHGDAKSIREIQIDVFENMLNIRDLVAYQRIYVQGTFLFLLQKSFSENLRDQREDTPKSTGRALSKTAADDFYLTDFRKSYKVLYTSSSAVTFAFYRVLNSIHNNNDVNDIVQLGVDIACPMSKSLEVVQVSDIKKNVRVDNTEMVDVCSTVFSSKSDISHMINKNFALFNQSLQSFKFTIPNY